MVDILTSWLITWSPVFIATVFFWIIWHIVVYAFRGGL